MPGAGAHALLPACTSCVQGYAGVAGPLPHGPQEHALEAGLSSDVTWPTTSSVKLGNASLCVCLGVLVCKAKAPQCLLYFLKLQ